jgi:hypothetical protein
LDQSFLEHSCDSWHFVRNYTMTIFARCVQAASAATLGLSLVAAMPAAAKTIVLQSSGPSASRYPVGRVLTEPLSLDLRSGDTLKVLDAAGTRVLKGPKKIRESGQRTVANDKRLALTQLISANSQRRSKTGAVRAAGLDGLPAEPEGLVAGSMDIGSQKDLWVIDPLKAGNWCIQDMDAVELWRVDSQEGSYLTVKRDSGGAEDARWPKGSNIIYWPANIPANDEERYFIQVDNNGGNFVTLHSISQSDDMLELATKLEASHCDHQFEILVSDEG